MSIQNAEIIKEYEGPVWLSRERQDEICFFTHEDFYNYFGDPKEYPNFLFLSEKINVTLCVDVEHVVEHLRDNACEGFDHYDIEGLKELGEAFDIFHEANKGTIQYEMDNSRIISVSDWLGVLRTLKGEE